MKVPMKIAFKVIEYQQLRKQTDQVYEEIRKYFMDETGAECVGEPFIADKPTGHLQNDDEYCDQHCIYEDWYVGTYYHPIEGSRKYVGYHYEC